MDALRNKLFDEGDPRQESDQSIGTIWVEELQAFIVLAWYKQRGTISSACVMGDDLLPIPLDLALAERILAE